MFLSERKPVTQTPSGALTHSSEDSPVIQTRLPTTTLSSVQKREEVTQRDLKTPSLATLPVSPTPQAFPIPLSGIWRDPLISRAQKIRFLALKRDLVIRRAETTRFSA